LSIIFIFHKRTIISQILYTIFVEQCLLADNTGRQIIARRGVNHTVGRGRPVKDFVTLSPGGDGRRGNQRPVSFAPPQPGEKFVAAVGVRESNGAVAPMEYREMRERHCSSHP
jgi:hypothetical protein